MSTQLNAIIKDQEIFVEQVTLTLKLLKVYKNNKEQFPLLIGKDIQEHYMFSWDNNEHIWESIDELTYDIIHKNKYFKFTSTGVFDTLHFSDKPNKKFKKDFQRILDLCDCKWRI